MAEIELLPLYQGLSPSLANDLDFSQKPRGGSWRGGKGWRGGRASSWVVVAAALDALGRIFVVGVVCACVAPELEEHHTRGRRS